MALKDNYGTSSHWIPWIDQQEHREAHPEAAIYTQLTGNAEDNSDGHCLHPAKNAFNLSVCLKEKTKKTKNKTNKKRAIYSYPVNIRFLVETRLQIVSETESNEITYNTGV